MIPNVGVNAIVLIVGARFACCVGVVVVGVVGADDDPPQPTASATVTGHISRPTRISRLLQNGPVGHVVSLIKSNWGSRETLLRVRFGSAAGYSAWRTASVERHVTPTDCGAVPVVAWRVMAYSARVRGSSQRPTWARETPSEPKPVAKSGPMTLRTLRLVQAPDNAYREPTEYVRHPDVGVHSRISRGWRTSGQFSTL